MRQLKFVLIFLVVLTGCLGSSSNIGDKVLPKVTDLERIHDCYREEFTQLAIPQPSGQSNLESATNTSSFARCLRLIRDFRTRYGEDSPEAAHLIVLEGMIYLQSGQVGMARLIADGVQKAEKKLMSGDGRYTRDALFAKNYSHLLKGWQEIHEYVDNLDTEAEYNKLEEAANGIARELASIDASKIAPEVDEGAIYVATTAAIFYVWVYKLKADKRLNPVKKDWFEKGYQLIGQYLSKTEKKAAQGADVNKEAPVGRIRYLEWYGYLYREANPQ